MKQGVTKLNECSTNQIRLEEVSIIITRLIGKGMKDLYEKWLQERESYQSVIQCLKHEIEAQESLLECEHKRYTTLSNELDIFREKYEKLLFTPKYDSCTLQASLDEIKDLKDQVYHLNEKCTRLTAQLEFCNKLRKWEQEKRIRLQIELEKLKEIGVHKM